MEHPLVARQRYTKHDVVCTFVPTDLPVRISSKIEVQSSGCWYWTAKISRDNGYGRAWFEGREQPAHRAVWLLLVGPLPSGKPELDHMCRHKQCVNPVCLEPVTRLENHRRWAMSITACPAGHDYTIENTRITKTKHGIGVQKSCKSCDAPKAARYKLRQAQKALAAA